MSEPENPWILRHRPVDEQVKYLVDKVLGVIQERNNLLNRCTELELERDRLIVECMSLHSELDLLRMSIDEVD